MPPPDLPGFFFDETKNRYFPLTLRNGPQGTSSRSSTGTNSRSQVSQVTIKDKQTIRLRSARRRTLDLGYSGPYPDTFATRYRQKHRQFTEAVANSSKGSSVFRGDFPCTSFHVSGSLDDESTTLSTGDSGGWLQTCRVSSLGQAFNSCRELYLGSEVTALCYEDSLRLAVSFGPGSKLAVGTTDTDSDRWTILSIPERRCHDIRTADLRHRNLVIGAASRALLMRDIEHGQHIEVWPTGSDVFSVCQTENLVYTGCRNGSVQIFDKRLDTRQKSQELYSARYNAGTRSITHLGIHNEGQMLISTIAGDLELMDLRFSRDSTPIVQFQGHVNSYSTKLGVAVSSAQSLVLAAGQDKRIRAWSLLDGQRIDPSSQLSADELPSHAVYSHLLSHAFSEPIVELQLYQSRTDGLTLWAASGKDIYRYGLGQTLFRGLG